MSKMLQKHDGEDGGAAEAFWPTTLVLDDEYVPAAMELLESTSVEVRMCAYAWRWYSQEPEIGIQQLNIALYRLRERGVRVRALVDTETMRRTFAELGFETRSVVNTRMLHTKAICGDADKLLIGSHNLTKRANTDNYECSVAIGDFEAIQQFIKYFDALWNSRG